MILLPLSTRKTQTQIAAVMLHSCKQDLTQKRFPDGKKTNNTAEDIDPDRDILVAIFLSKRIISRIYHLTILYCSKVDSQEK